MENLLLKKRVNALIELDQEPLESSHHLNIEEREKQCLQLCNFTVIRNSSKILDHISTQFSSGNLDILFGESGSGKSTLLIGLSGLLNHEGVFTIIIVRLIATILLLIEAY